MNEATCEWCVAIGRDAIADEPHMLTIGVGGQNWVKFRADGSIEKGPDYDQEAFKTGVAKIARGETP